MNEQKNSEVIKLRIFKVPKSKIIRYEITSTMRGKVSVTPDFQNALRKISSLHIEAIECLDKIEGNRSEI